MKPRMVSLFERTCRIVTGSRSVPSPGGTPLYCAMSAQAAVRREPGHSEHAETGRDWCSDRIQFAKARAVRERVRAPSCSRQDDVTFDIRGIVRDEDMRHCFPGHHLAELEWLGIRLSVVHTAAHV